MSTHVSTQKVRKEKGVRGKPNRKRLPFHITLEKETIELIRKKTSNASKFIEELVLVALKGEPASIVEILPKHMPGAGFEPATMRSSAARSPWLSYPGSKPYQQKDIFNFWYVYCYLLAKAVTTP